MDLGIISQLFSASNAVKNAGQQGKLGGFFQPPQLPTPAQLDASDLATATANLKSSGLEDAFAARKAYEENQARRGGFASAAGRGFIGGGMAVGAALPALANVDYQAAQREQDALNAEIGKLVDQRRFDENLMLTKEGNELQRESNKPKGLFAGLFGG